MEILTVSGGILSYLQDILGGILSSSTKRGGWDFVLHSKLDFFILLKTQKLLYFWLFDNSSTSSWCFYDQNRIYLNWGQDTLAGVFFLIKTV